MENSTIKLDSSESIHVRIRGQKFSKKIGGALKKIRVGSKKNSTSLEFFSRILVLEFFDERSHSYLNFLKIKTRLKLSILHFPLHFGVLQFSDECSHCTSIRHQGAGSAPSLPSRLRSPPFRQAGACCCSSSDSAGCRPQLAHLQSRSFPDFRPPRHCDGRSWGPRGTENRRLRPHERHRAVGTV